MMKFVTFLFVSMISLSAFCQDGAPRRMALLVGNWDYNLNGKYDEIAKDGYSHDLRTPCQDANLIKNSLQKNGFEVFDYCNLQYDEFNKKISSFGSFLSNIPKGSIVFVFYSGHGFQFHGRSFTVPVLFKFDQTKINKVSANEKYKFFRQNSNDLAVTLQKLTDDRNVALVIALDNCRENPVDEEVAYNEAVSIRTGPNTLIQYATTAGDLAPSDSEYANVLHDELEKGGDVGDIMARVGSRIWKLYVKEKRGTYAETNTGPAFAALKFTPLKVGTATAVATVSTPIDRTKKIVRNSYDGVSLDILWCEGEGEEARFEFARSLAQELSAKAKEFGVGRIQIKPLSVARNEHDGYNVHRNLMRYDVKYPNERALLVRIASAFPEGNFLPQRGVGVGGHPTPNYVSAFVCGRVS
ncbi:caspase family protein [Paraburkholderia caribensis]|uniref:caspase family protein n=1 Tax=Paraburkholderia caribensis TaxID=75105 RepID=UPI001314F1EC|nr:caspase family protein [Paraburkholderia caribensis]